MVASLGRQRPCGCLPHAWCNYILNPEAAYVGLYIALYSWSHLPHALRLELLSLSLPLFRKRLKTILFVRAIGATTLWDPWDASPQLSNRWGRPWARPPQLSNRLGRSPPTF